MSSTTPPITVGLVENPNCGKTTILNKLAKSKYHVGNYPRVTVTIKEHLVSYAVIYSQGEGSTEASNGLRQALAETMSPLVAFAFMVFALLYAPCLATIAAIRREAEGWRWAGFSVTLSLAVAWTLAFSIVTAGGVLS